MLSGLFFCSFTKEVLCLPNPARSHLRRRPVTIFPPSNVPSASCPTANTSSQLLALQRHFRVLTKFAHVESQLSGRKRQREAVFYAPVNLCDGRPCSTSVAVGLCLALRRLEKMSGNASSATRFHCVIWTGWTP